MNKVFKILAAFSCIFINIAVILMLLEFFNLYQVDVKLFFVPILLASAFIGIGATIQLFTD